MEMGSCHSASDPAKASLVVVAKGECFCGNLCIQWKHGLAAQAIVLPGQKQHVSSSGIRQGIYGFIVLALSLSSSKHLCNGVGCYA